MTEYIEREVLLEKLHEVGGCGAEPNTWADGYDKAVDLAYGMVQMMPTADVAPVRHGQWEKSEDIYLGFDVFCCSECGEEWVFESLDDTVLEKYRYCPACGAKMDGGEDNETN